MQDIGGFDESIKRVLLSSDILEFDDEIPTFVTGEEGNALIKAILEKHGNDDDRLWYVADRLDDLVTRMAHTYEIPTKENEKALRKWIYEKFNLGEVEERFVSASCSIIIHFTNLDYKSILREMLEIARRKISKEIIEKWMDEDEI